MVIHSSGYEFLPEASVVSTNLAYPVNAHDRYM